MCLLVFSYRQHPDYDLVFAANRDEFYGRPTRAAEFWKEEEYPSLLAGKDLEAGGTWMGVAKDGDFSALTNYRDPSISKEDPPSRGHLVRDFLINGDKPEEYMRKVHQVADRYNGFNLLTGNTGRLLYYSNQQKEIVPLQPGLYGLSNKLLDTPWPKVQKAKKQLAGEISSRQLDIENLFAILADDQIASDEQLPDTGIPKELEKAVSSIFINTERYGTRNSTVLLIEKSGLVYFEERRFKNGSRQIEEANRYEFQVKP